ncbi:integrin subunit alpha L [Phyllostomus discolor]|uniref:Integrin subunit alpha L n=1 Tax=Phyllostomus discolor TaxID=89673 RepID=A0A834B7N3_9CHIR|nr:integrin subunit alpha L [Phyllostomus discolor]
MNSCIIVMRLLLSGPYLFALASSYNLDVQRVQNLSFPHAGRHFGYRVLQVKPLMSQFKGLLVTNLAYTLQLDGHRTRSRGLFPGGRHELSRNIAVTPVKSCTEFWFHFPVVIQVMFHTLLNSSWEDFAKLHANVSCDNEDSGLLEDNSATTSIPVLYPINILTENQENSTLYISFTPKGSKIHQVKHIYQVKIQPSEHDHNMPTLEALIGVPPPHREGPITHTWSVQMEPPVDCQYENLESTPSVAEPCLPGAQFRCPVVFKKEILVQVMGTVELVGEIKASSMDSLCSSLSISFNSSKHFHLYGSNASLAQVIMKVDVVYEKDMLYLYVLSGIGGLLLLLLIFLALYKVGFFKRNLKEKMEATIDASNGIPGEDSGQQESEKEAVDPSGLDRLLTEKNQDGGSTD